MRRRQFVRDLTAAWAGSFVAEDGRPGVVPA